MGNGVSAAAQIPESVDKATAKALLGDNFDEAKFDAAAKEDGTVDKATFLAAVGSPEAEGQQQGTPATTEAAGTADASADAAPAATTSAKAFPPDAAGVPAADIEALHSRVRWNKEIPDIEKALAKNASMVHARDVKNGNYPLHIAAQNNHVDLVKLLLGRSADPNKQNGGGQTALHMAVTYEMHELIDILTAAGADQTIKNEDGHQAQHGLEGKKNSRYRELENILKDPTEAGLSQWFEQAVAKPENLDKTAIMQMVNFQAKKAMKASGTWTDAVNTKFTEMVRALP